MNINPTSANQHTTIPFPAPHPGSHGPAAGAEPNPGGRSPRGRPTTCAPRVLEMMKNFILEHGCSDTAAAEAFGISSTTISRWKKQDPEIACALLEARMGCRAHHLKKIEKHSESDSMRGLRASIWILERLFPGDYAAKMSERFEYRTLEDQRREREARALLDEDVKWRMEAEAEARAQAAAEAANAAQSAGPEKRASASETDSRNSATTMNPGADGLGVRACHSKEPGRPRPTDPDRAAALPITRDGVGAYEYDEGSAASQFESTGRGRPGSLNEAAPAENACVYSEGDSRNSRNSATTMNRYADSLGVRDCQSKEPGRPRPTDPNRAAALPITRDGKVAGVHHEGSAASPVGSTGRGRPSTELRTCGPDSLNEAAPAENACVYSEDDSRNSRNSPRILSGSIMEGGR